MLDYSCMFHLEKAKINHKLPDCTSDRFKIKRHFFKRVGLNTITFAQALTGFLKFPTNLNQQLDFDKHLNYSQ